MAREEKFERYTVENKGASMMGKPFCIYGWSTYGKNSVLAGQPQKVFIDCYETQEEALMEYPQATPSSKWMEPQVSLSHLPGPDDMVPGGAYPDDYDD